MDRRAFLKAVGATMLLPSLPLPASELIITGDPPPRMVKYTFQCDNSEDLDEYSITQSLYVEDGQGNLQQLSKDEWQKIFREGELR